MAWYNLGKVTITKGTKTLKGEGTRWTDNKVSINAGHIVLLPGSGTVQLYEVGKVISDTEMEIKTEYTGDNLASSTYSIITTVPSSVPDFARRLANQLKYYDDYLTFFGEWVDTDKEIEFQMPDGSIKKFPPLRGFVSKSGDTMSGSLGIEDKQFGQKIEINADAEQDRTSIGNKFKDGSLAVLSFYKDRLRYAGKDVLRTGDYGLGGLQRLGTSNLNDIKTPGYYQQDLSANATFDRNYPANTAGALHVLQSVNGFGNGCVQQYHVYAGVAYFQRTWQGSQWSGWRQFIVAGDYGLGYSANSNITPPQNTYKNANDVNFSGFSTGNGGDAVNFFEAYAPMISAARYGGSDNTGQVFQLQPTVSNTNPSVAFRTRNNNTWTDWRRLAVLNHDGNQYGSGELMFNRALGVGNKGGESDNAAWLSLQRGEPDFYIKRRGKPNTTHNFPQLGGILSGSANGVENISWKIASTVLNNGWYKVATVKGSANLRGVIFLTSTSPSYSAGSEYNKFSSFGHLSLTMGNGQQGDNLLATLVIGDDTERAKSSVEVRTKAVGNRYAWEVWMKIGNYSNVIANYTGNFETFTPHSQFNGDEPIVDNTVVFEKKKLLSLTNTQLSAVDNADLHKTDGDLGTCFFRQGGSPGQNYFGGWGSGINMYYDNNNAFKIFLDGNGLLQSSKHNNNSTNPKTARYWCNLNTTVDGNGFIKRASPIIEIFNSGKFNTNDESEGSSVEKLKEGVYLIKGVLGLHSDKSWGGEDGGFEIPVDKNKLPLIWIDYKVQEDGSILLFTYHRVNKDAPTFAQNNIEGKKDGEPIDIPKGRFVSVRVQMPEDSIYNKRMKEEQELMSKVDEESSKEYNNDTGAQEEPPIDSDIKLLEFKG